MVEVVDHLKSLLIKQCLASDLNVPCPRIGDALSNFVVHSVWVDSRRNRLVGVSCPMIQNVHPEEVKRRRHVVCRLAHFVA